MKISFPFKKKKPKNNFAVYSFPYFKKEQSFLRIFIAKALLAFVTCFAGASYYTAMLEVKESVFSSGLMAGMSCIVFMFLAGLFGRKKVLLFTGVFGAVLGFTFRDTLIEDGMGFWYYVLKISDGSIVNTKGLIKASAESDPVPILLLLCFIFGLIFAMSAINRFNPELIVTFFAIMVVPSFLTQHTRFEPSLAIFIAGLLAMWCTTLSAYANASLAEGSAANVASSDRQYRKFNKRQTPYNRIKNETFHFGKYLCDSLVILIVCSIIMGTVADSFPQDGNMKLDNVITAITEFCQKVSTWGTDLFTGIKAPYKGFFSADGGSINISNGIKHNDPAQGEIPVAEVVTQNRDLLYLRGDIGYEFDGVNWKSISKINYDQIKYTVSPSYTMYDLGFPAYAYGPSDEGETEVSVKDAIDNYMPEIQYYLARSSIGRTDNTAGSLDYIGAQKVKINYLQRLNTVLFAGSPFIFIFRDNQNFSVKGDFVGIADKGRINSMESAVLYKKQGRVESMLWDFKGLYGNEFSDFDGLPLSFDEYYKYKQAYEQYVYEYYTGISEEDDESMSRLADTAGFDSMVDYLFEDYSPDIAAAVFSETLVEYFTNGNFRYSLEADNFSKDDTPINTFLFDTKAGHCAMYASSMCLMLRHYGIPARYVTGFVVGYEEGAKVSEGYMYTLKQKDLHAWVEVYFDDFGWVPCDPTPSSGRPGHASSETDTAEETSRITTTRVTTDPDDPENTTTTTTTVSETPTGESSLPDGGGTAAEAKDYSGIIKVILIIAASLALATGLFIAITGWFRALNKRQNKKLKFFKNGDPKEAVSEMLEFSLKLLKIKGVIRQKGETPEEFAIRADSALDIGDVYQNAVPVFEKSEFAADPDFTKEEQQTVYICVTKLLKITLDYMRAPKRIITRVRLFGFAEKKKGKAHGK